MSETSMEADLTAWGKAIRLETLGRRSAQPRVVTIGYVVDVDGTLLVAASSESSGWAANLRAHPECVVELDGRREARTAVPLAGAERALAISGLILKYGTPAEQLGAGPAFRLVPR